MTSRNQFQALQGHVSLSEEESEEDKESATEAEMPSVECPHHHFVGMLYRSDLPGDAPGQGAFDNRFDFVLGDLGAHFNGLNRCDYVMSGATGEPHCSSIPDPTVSSC